jgi:hypothetical protein
MSVFVGLMFNPLSSIYQRIVLGKSYMDIVLETASDTTSLRNYLSYARECKHADSRIRCIIEFQQLHEYIILL